MKTFKEVCCDLSASGIRRASGALVHVRPLCARRSRHLQANPLLLVQLPTLRLRSNP